MSKNKLIKLKEILRAMDGGLILYSGGVDSTFLLKVASEIWPRGNLLALTAVSPTYPASEVKAAKEMAGKLRVRQKIIFSEELKDKNFLKNSPKRCYFCKKELFQKARQIAKKEGLKFVLDGSNFDDLKDYRPGNLAKKEFQVNSPLQEAALSKKEIRLLAKKIGLPNWNKPAMACLASRIPYGEQIDKDKLKIVEQAEAHLSKLGFKHLRVRRHSQIARIELDSKELGKALLKRKVIAKKFKQLGFAYIALDLEGYRTGSLNEVLYKK